jgi:hypothetical protein
MCCTQLSNIFVIGNALCKYILIEKKHASCNCNRYQQVICQSRSQLIQIALEGVDKFIADMLLLLMTTHAYLQIIST